MRNIKTYESFSGKYSSRVNESVEIEDNSVDHLKWTAELEPQSFTIYSSDYDWIMEELEDEEQIPMEFTFSQLCYEADVYIDSYIDSLLDNLGDNKRDYVEAWNSLDEGGKAKWYKRCEGRNPLLKKLSLAKGKVI